MVINLYTYSIPFSIAIPLYILLHMVLQVLNDSGDQDLCYYNFKCSHPYWSLRWVLAALHNFHIEVFV